MYPAIFKILSDLLVQAALMEVCAPKEANHGLEQAARDQDIVF